MPDLTPMLLPAMTLTLAPPSLASGIWVTVNIYCQPPPAFSHLTGGQLLVCWLHHLVPGGQVDPQLQPPCSDRPRHLAVHHAPPSRHPLQVARPQHALVAWKC